MSENKNKIKRLETIKAKYLLSLNNVIDNNARADIINRINEIDIKIWNLISYDFNDNF